jgi:polar amino acid transport system substrate-binding protein
MVLTLALPRPTVAQQLTIVSDPYPPLGYVKDGEIVGFTVELLKELLVRTGVDGTFAMYPWARAYAMAKTEKNVLIYQLTWTEERDRLFQLIGPVVGDTDTLWKLKKREDIVLDSLDDAKQYRVGVVRDYYVHQYLLEHGFEEGKNLEPIHDDDLNIKKLVSGRIDLMFLAEFIFRYRIKELGLSNDDFENALPVISNEGYLGFSRQTAPDIVARFERALEEVKADGTYDAIRERYGLSATN